VAKKLHLKAKKWGLDRKKEGNAPKPLIILKK